MYTLECAHRRQMLAVCALNERSLLIRGLPFPYTWTIGDVYIDSVILSIFAIFKRASCFIAHRSAVCRCLVRLPAATSAGKSSSTISGEFWGGRLGGVSSRLGFPLERRISLTLITMLISALGTNRALLRRLLGRGRGRGRGGGGAFALPFRRQVFASLDVSYTAAATFPPSRRCRLNGALRDELPLVTGLAPIKETNLRAEPCETLYATDASPRAAGGCVHWTRGVARLVRLGR